MEDDALISAVAGGDHQALRELFERHAPWLAMRMRRVLPGHAVEDVLQETFIAVWRGSKRFSGDGAVAAWIWGIARRQAALWARENRSPGEDTALLHELATEGPQEAAIRSADLDRAMAALGSAGDEQKELVTMIYLEDRTVADVAQAFGIPAGTVKSRLFAARKRLREALQGGR